MFVVGIRNDADVGQKAPMEVSAYGKMPTRRRAKNRIPRRNYLSCSPCLYKNRRNITGSSATEQQPHSHAQVGRPIGNRLRKDGKKPVRVVFKSTCGICNSQSLHVSLSHKKRPKSQNEEDKFHTPPTPEDIDQPAMTLSHKRSNRVQFGSPRAVEYEVDGPTVHLTPLPSEVTRKRYSMDPKEQTQEEEEMTIETKRNSAILAEWEDEVQATSSASRRRQQRKNRRSSSLFTPSPMSLLQDDEEHPSPSAVVMENLASLCVDSPAEQMSEPPISTPVSTSDSSFSDRSGTETAEFAINLDSVNTNGGAMDISPARLDETSSTTDTTPPPSNMNLLAIHSVGGALDRASPETFTLSKVHSPISRMNESSDHSYFKGIAVRFFMECCLPRKVESNPRSFEPDRLLHLLTLFPSFSKTHHRIEVGKHWISFRISAD